MFLFVSSSSFKVQSPIQLCENVTSTWRNLSVLPSIVVLREKKSEDKRMASATEDVDCWLQKNFNISESYTVPTKGDDEMICYKIATVPIKAGQLMVVVTEGSSADNCTLSLYGPIPNILNVKMYVDVSTNESVRRMELSLKNTGGHFGVQFELHRASVISKIQKTVVFMLQLSAKTLEYGSLPPFWNPTIDVPPESYQYRTRMEQRKSLTDQHTSISWLLIVSVMPMLIFGVVVSCYIVIHPVSHFRTLKQTIKFQRGRLTYTDEEIDFTIQEVESNSKVNTAQDKSVHLLPAAPMLLGDPLEMHTAKEPLLLTAVSSDEIPLDVTARSEKSTETVRVAIVNVGKLADSLKTGKEE